MSIEQDKIHTIVPIFIPWMLSWLVQSDPIISFFIAWLGSFFIFYWSLISPFRYINRDISIDQQIMRPIFFIQLVFAGFMCCSSIFYFLDNQGYVYFDKVNTPIRNDPQTYLIAQCQRLAVLGHAALVAGLIWNIKFLNPVKEFKLTPQINQDRLLIQVSIGAYITGMIVKLIPAIFQFSIGLINMAIICAAFLLVKGILHKKFHLMITGGILFTINLVNASLSGFKEPILVSFLIMGCLFFPYYKRLVLIIGIPVMYGLFYILPTYVSAIRTQSWDGQLSAIEARSNAFETIFNAKDEIAQTNWAFLTNRLSEIGMFTKFVDNTPRLTDYYGFEIVINAIESVVPRFLWSSKPNTEALAMERVYNAGVVNRSSTVSAKTRPIVDAYLSAGTFGVFISLFIYGFITQWLCNKAESLFGGYQLGCIVVFNGMFQSLWRGNNFEFLLNSVFWSFILMSLVHAFFKSRNILIPVDEHEVHINQRLL